jgi:hypothetical protein
MSSFASDQKPISEYFIFPILCNRLAYPGVSRYGIRPLFLSSPQ